MYPQYREVSSEKYKRNPQTNALELIDGKELSRRAAHRGGILNKSPQKRQKYEP